MSASQTCSKRMKLQEPHFEQHVHSAAYLERVELHQHKLRLLVANHELANEWDRQMADVRWQLWLVSGAVPAGTSNPVVCTNEQLTEALQQHAWDDIMCVERNAVDFEALADEELWGHELYTDLSPDDNDCSDFNVYKLVPAPETWSMRYSDADHGRSLLDLEDFLRASVEGYSAEAIALQMANREAAIARQRDILDNVHHLHRTLRTLVPDVVDRIGEWL